MIAQDVRIVGLGGCRLHRPAEEGLGLRREGLVEGRVEADEHRQRLALAAACAPGLLPEAGRGARAADVQRAVQLA